MKRIFLALIGMVLLFAPSAFAAEYFVSPNGNDLNSGTEYSPFRTIQKAANYIKAGDTCTVLAGTYPERISVSTSGRSGAPVTFRAEGKVSIKGFSVSGNYVTVKGFTVQNDVAGWVTGSGIYVNGNHCTIEDNYVYYCPGGGIILTPSTSACVVRNNRCYRNTLIGIWIQGTGNLAETNEVWGSIVYHPIGHTGNGDTNGFFFHGSGHTFRGNYIHDILYNAGDNAGTAPHVDAFQTWTSQKNGYVGATDCVFEDNLIYMPYSATNGSACGWQMADAHRITFKNNIVFVSRGTNSNGGGVPCSDLEFYNNVWVGEINEPASGNPGGISVNYATNVTIKNNIIYNKVSYTISTTGATGLDIDYNCVYNSNGTVPPSGVRARPHDLWGVNPRFVNPGQRDFRLQANSPCLDAGIRLAKVTDDYDGTPRPQGSGFDIGPYEATGSTSANLPSQPQELRLLN